MSYSNCVKMHCYCSFVSYYFSSFQVFYIISFSLTPLLSLSLVISHLSLLSTHPLSLSPWSFPPNRSSPSKPFSNQELNLIFSWQCQLDQIFDEQFDFRFWVCVSIRAASIFSSRCCAPLCLYWAVLINLYKSKSNFQFQQHYF